MRKTSKSIRISSRYVGDQHVIPTTASDVRVGKEALGSSIDGAAPSVQVAQRVMGQEALSQGVSKGSQNFQQTPPSVPTTPDAQKAESGRPCTAISAFSPGLTVVAIRDKCPVQYVRWALELSALEGGTELGIPFPTDQRLLSLYSGNDREVEQARYLAGFGTSTGSVGFHSFRVVGSSRRFNWCGPEGRHVLLDAVREDGGWVTVHQETSGPITSSAAEGLLRISSGAREAGVRVMFFLVCSETACGLEELCDEYVEVTSCEPDIGWKAAFLIDCVGISHLDIFDIGKAMCSVGLASGALYRKYDPFISKNLDTRLMWVLRGQGETYEEIAKIFQVNKTSVLRRLRSLPPPRSIQMEEGWLARHLEWRGAISGDPGAGD